LPVRGCGGIVGKIQFGGTSRHKTIPKRAGIRTLTEAAALTAVHRRTGPAMALLLLLLIRLAVIAVALVIPAFLIRAHHKLKAERRDGVVTSHAVTVPVLLRPPPEAAHDSMRPGLDRARLHAQFAEITAELADIDDFYR
jgi:hypothetical protein